MNKKHVAASRPFFKIGHTKFRPLQPFRRQGLIANSKSISMVNANVGTDRHFADQNASRLNLLVSKMFEHYHTGFFYAGICTICTLWAKKTQVHSYESWHVHCVNLNDDYEFAWKYAGISNKPWKHLFVYPLQYCAIGTAWLSGSWISSQNVSPVF